VTTDTDALIQTVRETFEKWQRGEFAHMPNWWEPALTALDSLAALEEALS
jgi:hypothetical protein